MFWLRLIYSRLHGLLRKNRIEQEMEDEMRFHLLMRTRDNVARGMKPEEAEREARRRFGNVGRIKDLARDIKGGGFMEALLQDMRYGARMLLKNPGFVLALEAVSIYGRILREYDTSTTCDVKALRGFNQLRSEI